MSKTEWWNHNAKYVKAYAGYIVILWAFHLVTGFLHLHTAISSGLKAVGVPETPSLWVSATAYWLAFTVLGFYIFRNAVRKFVVHRPE